MANKQRENVALSAIKSLLGKPDGEESVALFVEHHVDELETDYFSRMCGTSTPDATQMLDSLILLRSWSFEDDGNIDVFDFSLPENVTDCVLSVRFSGDKVEDVTMDS